MKGGNSTAAGSIEDVYFRLGEKSVPKSRCTLCRLNASS
jgi:hypothetical protein